MKKFVFIPTIVYLLVLSTIVSADTIIPGGFVSGTWVAAGSPYLIEGEITIHADSSLTIDPGVEVNFQTHCKFIVEGILQAVGTEQDSILFTAAIPDTGWRGIRFESAPDGSQLSYCILEYGRATVGTIFYERRGGGIYSTGSSLEITHCTIRDCYAEAYGGGIYANYSSVEISDCNITENSADGDGGGIYATGGSVEISDCNITENSAAADGGGIYMANSDSVTFSGCTISNNSAGVTGTNFYRGGGIYFSGSHITISGCTISGNDSDDDGGGCYLEAPLLITNSIVSDNTTTGVFPYFAGEGAGIYTDYGVTMDSCTITGNQSITRGSGIYATGGLNLANSIFSGNTAVHDGTIFFMNGGGSIENCIISDNQGGNGGNTAGVRLFNANLVISGCSFTGNASDSHVGALYMVSNSTVQLSYCTFSENFGVYDAGGIYVAFNSQADIDHCTFTSNVADSAGAILVESDGNVDVTNSIFSGNSPNGILRRGGGTIDYSDFFGNGQNVGGIIPAGFGELTTVNTNGDSCDVYSNIFLDPLFVGGGDYHLTEDSPCIDAGDPASPLDPDSTITDMGRYYFDQTPATPVTVTLTPYSTPIQIPANGGSFDFNIEIENSDPSPNTIDIWTLVTLPNGNEYGPIINVLDFNAPANWTGNRDRTQAVPVGAPSGTYTYDAYVGVYPDTVYDEDHFDFEKLTTGDGAIVADWSSWGEDFGNLVGDRLLSLPEEYALYNAHPNPFNPTTTIRFDLPEAGRVSLKVYNVQGREVAKLVDGFKPAGTHEITFNGSELSSGVYFMRLEAGEFNQVQKVVLMK